MKDKNKTSNYTKLKDLREQEKQAHKQQVNDKIKEVSKDPLETQARFNNSKRLRWYDYITVSAICAALTGFSYILGIYAFKDINMTEWLTTFFAVISLGIFLIIGWIKNRSVANYYNDARRRYQTTLSEEEGFLRRISKIALLTSLVLTVISIIVWVAL